MRPESGLSKAGQSEETDVMTEQDESDREPASSPDGLLEVHLARYASLREEVFQRIGLQSQAFSYLVIVLGAGVGVAGTLLDRSRGDLVPPLVFLLPIVTAPLAYIFFDNEIMLFGIGGHIATDLSDRVSQATGSRVTMSTPVFRYLEGQTRSAHRWLSYGRWLAFVLPTLGPTLYAILRMPSYGDHPGYWLVLLADVGVTAILLWAIWAVYREHEKPGGWRSRAGAGSGVVRYHPGRLPNEAPDDNRTHPLKK